MEAESEVAGAQASLRKSEEEVVALTAEANNLRKELETEKRWRDEWMQVGGLGWLERLVA